MLLTTKNAMPNFMCARKQQYSADERACSVGGRGVNTLELSTQYVYGGKDAFTTVQ